jgi:hypothetical protein
LEAERRELQEKLSARREEKERKLEEKLQAEQRIRDEKRELYELRQQEKTSYFLKTKTNPTLCYLPEKLTDEMELILKKQRENVLEARKQFEMKIGSGTDENITNDPLPASDDDKMTDDEAEEKK